jgi:ABC-type multidrug transport system fused ATPase/permease subunit
MFKKLFAPTKHFKLRYILYMISAAYFWVIRPIYALIVSKIIKWIELKDFNYFKIYIFVFFCLLVLNYSLNYFLRTLRKVTTRLFQKNLYEEYLSKYLKADNNKIEWLWTWQSNSILQKWCDNRQRIVMDVFSNWLIRILINIIAIFTIITVNLWWIVFIIIFFVFIIMMLLAWIWNQRMRHIRNWRREVFIRADRTVVRLIMSKFEILQNNKIIKEIKVISKSFTDLIWWDIKESRWSILASDTPRALLDFMKLLLIARYGYQIFKWNADFAQFTLIRMLMNQMTGVIFESNDLTLSYFEQIPFVQRLRTTFDEIPKLKWYEEWNTFKFNNWNILIDNISFNYWDKNIFSKFSLEIQWWKKTALVGESWSGKTTLIKMLSWYIHPDKWYITIDWQKLSETSLKSYYKNIWYLTQEPNVFDWSIVDNLLYWTREKPTKKQIENAIKASKCEFINTFKDWLDTQIWEKWVRLSWGQKQRLAIAKLFIKDPKIIFLDEPTSSLDSFSEEDIAQAFNNLFKWRTVIVAAHRLQTVKQADIIHVFKTWWKIIESWTHTQLLNKKWTYYKMIELQSGF